MSVFYGRQRELDALDALAPQGSAWSLIALVGPLGVGKRTLAQRWLMGRQALWCRAPARATEGELMARLAQALDAPLELDQEGDQGLEAAADRVGLALSSRPGLILVWEAEGAGLAGLRALWTRLGRAPQARWMLLTPGRPEGFWPEPSLVRVEPWPCEGQDSVAAHALRAMAPQVADGPQQREALAQLAAQAEGLPGALALLARQLRWYSPKQLLERALSQQAEQPPTGALAQAITLALRGLSAQGQQALIGALTTFEPRWSQEDASHVLGPTLAQALHEAVEQGLLTRDAARGQDRAARALWSQVRALHPSSPQADAWAARWSERLARRAWGGYLESVGDAWAPQLEEIALERDALERALERALDPAAAPQAALAPQLLLGLSVGLKRSGEFDRLRRWLERVRQASDAGMAPSPDQATWSAQQMMTRAALLLVEADTLELLWKEGRAFELLAQAVQDDEASGQALAWPDDLSLLLTLRLLQSANFAYEVELGQRALARWRELKAQATLSERQRVVGDLCEGHFLTHVHAYEEAHQLLEGVIARASAAGWPQLAAHAQMVIGHTYQYLGQMPQAGRALLASLEHYRQAKRADALAHALRACAWFMVDAGEHEVSGPLLEELVELGRRHGLAWAVGVGCFLQGQRHLDRGEDAQAAPRYAQALYHLEREREVEFSFATRFYSAVQEVLHAGPKQEGAGQALEQLVAQLDALPSRWGQIQVLCYASALRAGRGDLEVASALSARAQALSPPGNALLKLTRGVCDAAWRLAQSQEQAKQRRMTQALALQREALQGLREALDEPPQGGASPSAQALELRLGLRLVAWALDAPQRRRLALMLEDPEGQALLLDREARHARMPGEARWLDLSKRHVPWALLMELTQALNGPVPATTLCARLWPEEATASAETLQSRLYVTVTELRREGLGQGLESGVKGYALASGLKVVSEPSARAWWLTSSGRPG